MKINLMHGFYYSFSSMLSLKCSFTFSIQQLLNSIYLGGAYGNLAVSGSKEQKICCSLSSYYYITFSLLWHLFLHILHSHANTSHQLFSTCSGIRYIQCAAVTPPLSPTQCSFLGPLYSLYICTYIYILCALCIMRHVVQMKIKNTSGNFCLNPQHRLCISTNACAPPCHALSRAFPFGDGSTWRSFRSPSLRWSPNNLYASVRTHFWALKFLYSMYIYSLYVYIYIYLSV